MMKKLVAMILALLLLLMLVLPAQASEVMPRYTYVDNIVASLDIDTSWGIARCQGEIVAKDDYPVKVIVDLQKYIDGEWTTIQTWSNRGVLSAYVSGRYAITSGYNYRTYVRGYVYDENGTIVEATSNNCYQEFYN